MTKEVAINEKNVVAETTKEIALEMIITNAIKIRGAKVNRKEFLTEIFEKENIDINSILENGPVVAGVDEKKLHKLATKLILDRTAKSSIASFAMGIPGGLAMAVTIPADILQFYGMTLKLAQELTYLYGAQDIWKDGKVDSEMVRNQLMLYCGVMFGVSGAAAGVRLLSAHLAKATLKKLPQKALTKTFWYPILKQVGKKAGVTITKKSLANGVTKVIPVVAGVISGTITFVSMKPMADRLQKTLEEVNFHYTEEQFNKDIESIDNIDGVKDVVEDKPEKKNLFQKGKEKIGGLFHKKDNKKEDEYAEIKKLKELLDMGAITQEEYDEKKKQILCL